MIKGILLLVFFAGAEVFAQEMPSEKNIINQAKIEWMKGASHSALEILDQGLQKLPNHPLLLKLRGDILTTIRENQEALEAYTEVLKYESESESLDVRWAKWSVLTRLGEDDLAIVELEQIAKKEPQNPLVHLHMARELRKLDRLEESVQWYRKAVQLAPDLPGWHLALGRALFDILDYEGARKEVEGVI